MGWLTESQRVSTRTVDGGLNGLRGNISDLSNELPLIYQPSRQWHPDRADSHIRTSVSNPAWLKSTPTEILQRILYWNIS